MSKEQAEAAKHSNSPVPMPQADNSEGLEARMRHLQELTKERCLDLRFLGGSWCVLHSIGNTMCVVTGSVALTAIESVDRCIHMWHNRSPERPFGSWPNADTPSAVGSSPLAHAPEPTNSEQKAKSECDQQTMSFPKKNLLHQQSSWDERNRKVVIYTVLDESEGSE